MTESMSLLDRINADLKQAMRDHDDVAKLTLRSVKASVTEGSKTGAGALESDEQVVAVIQLEAKRRRDAAHEYQRVGEQERAAQELAELAILERYLPRQLSAEEIEVIVRDAITATGATSMRDMGRVMPVVMQQVKGLADGNQVNQIVRSLLA